MPVPVLVPVPSGERCQIQQTFFSFVHYTYAGLLLSLILPCAAPNNIVVHCRLYVGYDSDSEDVLRAGRVEGWEAGGERWVHEANGGWREEVTGLFCVRGACGRAGVRSDGRRVVCRVDLQWVDAQAAQSIKGGFLVVLYTLAYPTHSAQRTDDQIVRTHTVVPLLRGSSPSR